MYDSLSHTKLCKQNPVSPSLSLTVFPVTPSSLTNWEVINCQTLSLRIVNDVTIPETLHLQLNEKVNKGYELKLMAFRKL